MGWRANRRRDLTHSVKDRKPTLYLPKAEKRLARPVQSPCFDSLVRAPQLSRIADTTPTVPDSQAIRAAAGPPHLHAPGFFIERVKEARDRTLRRYRTIAANSTAGSHPSGRSAAALGSGS